MNLFVIDDTHRVSSEVEDLTGVRHYGALIRQRETVETYIRRLLAPCEECHEILRLVDLDDVRRLATRLALSHEPSDRCLFWPSFMAPASDGEGAIALAKLLFADVGTMIAPNEARAGPCAVLHDRDGALRHLERRIEEIKQDLVATRPLEANVVRSQALRDVRGARSCVEYMTRSFEARFFNDVAFSDNEVVKRSRDKAKMRAEHDGYYLLPPAMQRHFVQPFDFRDEGEYASYRMERYVVPNLAVQWVNGAIGREDFAALLRRLFEFVSERPRRPVDRETFLTRADALYRHKVRERLERLAALPIFPAVERALTSLGGVGHLQNRFEALYDRFAAERAARAKGDGDTALVTSHGDLCFSNILFDKRTGLMRLIDPKGGVQAADLELDPLYDLAKLSHSIKGGYDFVNLGLFDFDLDAELRLSLKPFPFAPPWATDLFDTRLREIGVEPRHVRLAEASLFLSMTPLHGDHPRKVVSFFVIAERIIRECEETP